MITDCDKQITKKTQRGEKITYTKHFMFGKTDRLTSVVVANNGKEILLDTGDSIRFA